MRKLITIAIVLCTSICTLTSCGLSSLADIDFDAYKKVEYTEDGWRIYQGNKYYPTGYDLFDIIPDHENDVVLSWHGNFPFSGGLCYYSDTTYYPMYMYNYLGNSNEVWIIEDFDYTFDLFVIENTDIEIVFSEAFTDNTLSLYNFDLPRQRSSFIWHSKTLPRLQIKAEIFQYNDRWYMWTLSFQAWEISDEFLNLLIENSIINIE